MSNGVFEDNRSWEVSDKRAEVELFTFEDGALMVTAREHQGWESQNAQFTMTRQEATAMKEFLIKKGY